MEVNKRRPFLAGRVETSWRRRYTEVTSIRCYWRLFQSMAPSAVETNVQVKEWPSGNMKMEQGRHFNIDRPTYCWMAKLRIVQTSHIGLLHFLKFLPLLLWNIHVNLSLKDQNQRKGCSYFPTPGIPQPWFYMMTDSPNGPLTPLSLTHLCQLEQQIKEMKTWHWLQVTQSCIETKHVVFFF